MGFIEKRGKNRWRARYRITRGEDRGKERSHTFTKKSDAEKWLAAQRVDQLRGEWVDPHLSSTTFAAWVERWQPTTAPLKQKTRANYDSLLRTHILPKFGSLALDDIEPILVREWVSGMNRSPSRVRQSYFLLSSILNAAVESGYISRNPCIGVRLPRATREEMQIIPPKSSMSSLLLVTLTRRSSTSSVSAAYVGVRLPRSGAVTAMC